MVIRSLVPALAVVVAAALAAPPPAPAAWRWPVHGPVLRDYRYDEATPFARGLRRGIDVGGAAGASVRSACAGRVMFAGGLPWGRGVVSVACGALAVSYLRLASLAVRRGDSVAAGDRLGRLGPRGLHFGVRRRGRRWAYVDPLSLLGAEPGSRPVPAMPRRPRPTRPVPLGPAPRRAPVPRTAPVPRRLPAARPLPAAPAVPLAAWAGLALLAAGLPAWGVRRARRRRRRVRAEGAVLRVR